MLLPKKNLIFMHGFKSAILEEWKNCQNDTFEPVHEIQLLLKVPYTKNNHNVF